MVILTGEACPIKINDCGVDAVLHQSNQVKMLLLESFFLPSLCRRSFYEEDDLQAHANLHSHDFLSKPRRRG